MTLSKSAFDNSSWQQDNQHDLAGRLEGIRVLLMRALQREYCATNVISSSINTAVPWLAETFQLSSFEADLLMLCAAVEMDSGIASLCAEINGDPRRSLPTFGMALTILPQPHWSALAPTSPLRHWRLLNVVSTGEQLTRSPLMIDERILHFIAGIDVSEPQLAGFACPVTKTSAPLELAHSNQHLAELMQVNPASVILLSCPNRAIGIETAHSTVRAMGSVLFSVRVIDIPTDRLERHNLSLLVERECQLKNGMLLINSDGDAKSHMQIAAFISEMQVPVIVTCDSPPVLDIPRKVVRLALEAPLHEEQKRVWNYALSRHGLMVNGYADRLSTQFRLTSSMIHAAVEDALTYVEAEVKNDSINELLWDACRRQAQPGLSELAQRIETLHSWDDIVLPESQKEMLRSIVTHIEQRHVVYETWGYGADSRGIGTSVIFAGGSGTGKTLAAEIVASALRLDLYRIDLSGVVSKYIGETEKNLRRIFTAAEQGGAILLFDEADALFGKRSEVRDSHDRYANIEVSYLLQQMESYRGLAILTTNMLDNFDRAFLRRVRFIIQFPFPTAEQRHAIWERAFPPQAPTSRLDYAKLSRLNITGGNIRNIALNAAFLAAGRGEEINMKHLLRSAASEYAKLEKPLPDADVKDWWRYDA